MSYRHYRYGVFLLCALLAACNTNSEAMREDLGLVRKPPDEYRVYSRPPLNMPPEFNLRPPVTGAAAATAASTDAQAQAHDAILSGDTASAAPMTGASAHILPGSAPSAAIPLVSASQLPSSADAQFLSDAGAVHDANIREQVDKESGTSIGHKNSTYLFDGKADGDPIVDASKEKQRLQQDKAQSQPPTTGDTPVIAPKDKGILGGIF